MNDCELRTVLESLLPKLALGLQMSQLTEINFEHLSESGYRAHFKSDTIPDVAFFTVELVFDDHKQLIQTYLDYKFTGRRQVII